jgi:hypothetical protein
MPLASNYLQTVFQSSTHVAEISWFDLHCHFPFGKLAILQGYPISQILSECLDIHPHVLLSVIVIPLSSTQGFT